MTTVKPFDRSVIETYLLEQDLNYLKDRDGDFQVKFNYDEDCGCALTVWFVLNNSIYRVQVVSDKPIPRQDWEKIVMLCNTWNQQKRWPKAYLNISNPETDQNGFIVLEEHIDLQQGIHQELFNDWTSTVISASSGFWMWLNKEQELFDN
jgi:hypothetical protein